MSKEIGPSRSAPTTTSDVKDQQQPRHLSSCDGDYIRGQEVGRGGFGVVYAACKQQDCNFVLKIQDITNESRRHVAFREPYFMNLLKDVQVNHARIVPRLFEYWTCDLTAEVFPEGEELLGPEEFEEPRQALVMAMERWDGDLALLGLTQASHPRYASFFARMASLTKEIGLPQDVMVLSEADLLRAFGVAQALTALGIVFSDLSLPQFLFKSTTRKQEEQQEHAIVVTDFGFAGDKWGVNKQHGRYEPDWGWCVDALKCPAKWNSERDDATAPYMNVWQLETSLMLDAQLWIASTSASASTSSTSTAPAQLRLFVGISNLPQAVRQQFGRLCGDYQYGQMQAQYDLASKNMPVYQLDMAKIQRMGGRNGALVAYGMVLSYQNWKPFLAAWDHPKTECKTLPDSASSANAVGLDSESEMSDDEDEDEDEEDWEFDLDENVSVKISEWVRTNRALRAKGKSSFYPEEVFVHLKNPSTDTRSSRTSIYTSPPVWLMEKVDDGLFATLSKQQLDRMDPVREVLKKLDILGQKEGWFVLVHASD